MITCTAITHNGSRCQRNASSNGRCPWHGGKPLPGKWSKEIPEYLRPRYDIAVADQHPLSLHDDLALIDTCISDLLTRIQSNERGAAWKQFQQTFQALEAARTNQETAKQAQLIKKLKQIAAQSLTEHIVWANIQALMEQRRRLIETEHRRIFIEKNYVTQDQAISLADALAEAVYKHVTDPAIRTAVTNDFTGLIKEAIK